MVEDVHFCERAFQRVRWIPAPSAEAGASRESDLNVFAKAFEEGLDRGQIADALSWREVEREDDLLEVGLADGVEVELSRQVSPEPAVGVLDAALLPAGPRLRTGGIAEPGGPAADAGGQAVAGELAAPPRSVC